MEQKKECAREGNSNAQNAVKGKEYQNPLTIVYHGKNDVSSTEKKKVHFYYGMGIKELNCAYCGKNFIPTRPEYAWGNCCSYTCSRRYDEIIVEKATRRGVVMLHPKTHKDILVFDSTKAAAEFAKVEARYIRDACNGLSETSGGYAWRWEDEEAFKESESAEKERLIDYSTSLPESIYRKIVSIANDRNCKRSQIGREIIVEHFNKEKENENS